MSEKKRPQFPKGFFSKPRPTISTKEALKDVIPVEWSEEVLSKKRKAVIYSANELKKQKY